MRLAVLLVVLLLLMPAGLRPAAGQEEVVRKTKYFDLMIEDGLALEAKDAREIEGEIEKGLEAACDLLGVGTRQVFYDGVPAPFWMGEVDRMKFVIRPRVPEKQAGVESWTKQLFKGGFRMSLPYPVEGLTVAYRARIRRAAGVTVLGNTLYRTRVPWWTEGVLALLEARADEEGEIAAAHRKAFAEIPPEELEARVQAMFAATSETEIEDPTARALAFVMMSLVENARPELISHLQRQLQTMAYHLYLYPDEEALRRDFLEIARSQWQSAIGAPRWAEMLRAWADAGWPERSGLRRLRELRELRKYDLPEPFEVAMTGHWGGSFEDDQGYRCRTYENAAVAWRLPATVRRHLLWIGLLEKLPRGEPLEPKKLDDGAAAVLADWNGEPQGRRSFADRAWIVGYVPDHYEFSLLHVVSEYGVQYRFHRYGKR